MEHLSQILPVVGGALNLAAALTNLVVAHINRNTRRQTNGVR